MTAPNATLPVLVLPLDHHGAVGVARSLGRLGVPVYGVHRDGSAPAFRSRYLRQGFVWDLEAETPARSVAFLLGLAARIGAGAGGRALLLATNDETALFVAENAAALAERFIFPPNPPALVRGLFEKARMHALARAAGLPTPETVIPQSRAEVERFCETAQFPVMLKASDGVASFRHSGRKMAITRTPAELLRAYDEMEDPQRPFLMLQEYIPGGEDSVWMFNGYFDGRSECLVGFTGKKIRQNPVYTGMTALGVCVRNETVEQLTRTFMKAIGYRGILDIGYRYDARDGLYKVLDVNPRVGATFRLFVGDGGLDVVRAMYLHLTGQRVPAAQLREGRRWVVEQLDLSSSARYFRDGKLTLAEWLRSFRGVEESAWFARDDLGPFGDLCARTAAAPLRRTRALVQRLLEDVGARAPTGPRADDRA